jgi:DNA polymerase elongation subunit (family B)
MTRIVYDKFNGITVGGDTDSVFVQVKDATHQIQAKTQSHEERMKEYFNLCEIIANTCSEGLPYPVKIGVDGIYMSLIISTRKKCYVAFEYSTPTNFKVKHQGVQYKKRDRAPFVRKNAAHIVELILNNKKHEVKPFITNLLNQLIKLEIPKEQFIITQLYKGTDNYKVKNLPIITVVNTMKSQNLNVYPGDRIPYIITYNPNKKNIYQKSEIPNINNPKQIPDYLHYLKSLESSLEFCFEYVDCNFNWHTLIQSYYIKLNNILTAKSNPNPLTNYFQSLKSKTPH